MDTKTCKICKEIKDKSCFHREPDNKDGLRTACAKCRSLKLREWRSQNRDSVNTKAREYKRARPDKIREIAKRSQSKPSYKERVRQNKRNMSIDRRLKERLRTRLWHAVKGITRGTSAVRDLGCSIEEFKSHLESQFQPGMSWHNYAHDGWHIDHIVPLSQALTEEETKKLQHYSNLRPMWSTQNMSKSKKRTPEGETLCFALLNRQWVDV